MRAPAIRKGHLPSSSLIVSIIDLLIFVPFYKLDEKDVANMMQELKNRSGTAPDTAAPITHTSDSHTKEKS